MPLLSFAAGSLAQRWTVRQINILNRSHESESFLERHSMAREGADFSESEVIYPPAVDGAPSRALVATTAFPSAAPAPGVYPSRGPEILSGGFNQTWLINCLRRRWLMAILMGMLVGAGVGGLLGLLGFVPGILAGAASGVDWAIAGLGLLLLAASLREAALYVLRP